MLMSYKDTQGVLVHKHINLAPRDQTQTSQKLIGSLLILSKILKLLNLKKRADIKTLLITALSRRKVIQRQTPSAMEIETLNETAIKRS